MAKVVVVANGVTMARGEEVMSDRGWNVAYMRGSQALPVKKIWTECSVRTAAECQDVAGLSRLRATGRTSSVRTYQSFYTDSSHSYAARFNKHVPKHAAYFVNVRTQL